MIALTEELLDTANQNDGSSGLVTGTSGEVSPNLHLSGSSFDVSLLPTFVFLDFEQLCRIYRRIIFLKKALHLGIQFSVL